MHLLQQLRSAGIALVLMMAILVTAMNSPTAQCAPPPFASPTVSVVATGLQGSLGSTVGPDGPCMLPKGLPAGYRGSTREPTRSPHLSAACPRPFRRLGLVGQPMSHLSIRPCTSWSHSSVPTSGAALSMVSIELTIQAISPS